MQVCLKGAESLTFSVVMPIYGVEKYLRQGIDSVLAQTFRDFEIILVDDRSPDGCPQICDEYAEIEPRVRVIHKEENQGLGEARNTGFAAAEGDYVFFMDSDDYVEPDLFENVFEVIKGGADIVVYGLRTVYENKDGVEYKREDLCPTAAVYEDRKAVGNCFIDLSRNRVFPFAWNKIYRREFLAAAAIPFERTKLIEDFLFNIAVFQKAEKIAVLDKVFYNYRKPAHQTLASAYSPEFFSLAKRKFSLEREYIENMGVGGEDNRQFVMENHLKHIVSTVIRNGSVRASLKTREQKAKIKEILADEDTKLVLAEFKPRGIQLKVIKATLKIGCPTLVLLLSKAIAFLQKHL